MLPDNIHQYSFTDILAIEESDRQFLALKSAWELVKNIDYGEVPLAVIQEVFLKAVVYNALISYQIAGSGELRWEEFSQKLYSDFDLLLLDFIQGNNSLERRYNLMITSKYNKRLYNLKYGRLQKIAGFSLNSFDYYYDNMDVLWRDLSSKMAVDPYSKTISFAVKMFGYAARVVYGRFVPYPFEISIPVDSRIRRIFLSRYPVISDREIIEKTYELSRDMGVAPLHLDSLFWVKQ